MPLVERQNRIAEIESLRSDRKCICFFNFDRESEPTLPGLSTMFSIESKEPLFRVLKEIGSGAKIDLCLYTRGGQVNAVWPIVSLIREFDRDFQVIVPYGCHSAGTITALGASKIVLSPLSELSPIDPTGGNQFNPEDSRGIRIGISVEDVAAYSEFVSHQLKVNGGDNSQGATQFIPFLAKLTERIHPLALGSIHRVQQQGRRLAKELLKTAGSNSMTPEQIDSAVDELSSKFFSHQHMINRHEAKSLLGNQVEFADPELSSAMDRLLRQYEDDFRLRHKFAGSVLCHNGNEEQVRFIGGAIESANWSYLYETELTIRKVPIIPANIQIQLQPGQPLTPVKGLPSRFDLELVNQGWIRNTAPKGVTT